jgi:tetratricopeptide (TPR) repeat protein
MSIMKDKVSKLIKEKKYEEAEQYCYNVLKTDKTNIDAYNGLGYMHYRVATEIKIAHEGVPDKEAFKRRLCELDKARKYLLEASKIGPDEYTYRTLAEVYHHLRAYDSSIECYKKIERDSKDYLILSITKYNYLLELESYNKYIQLVEEREREHDNCEITEDILDFWERPTDAYKAFLKEEAKNMPITNKMEWELQKKWFRLKHAERDKYGYV